MSEHNVRLATRAEVADALRISRKTFDRLVAPMLTKIPIGRRVMYRWEDVELWLRAQEVGASVEMIAPEYTPCVSGMRPANDVTAARARQISERLKKKRLKSTRGR